MKATVFAVLLAAALAAPQAGTPINAQCPVKPNQKARATNVVLYEGQVIGFCWASCKPRFAANPQAYLAAIPEFKMPEKKPGPCAADKIVKALFCLKCEADVPDKELKNGACAKCETKPVKVEYCVKTDPATKTQDKARITYGCAGCDATSEVEAEFKHKDDCKKKVSALKKVCSRSGTTLHQTLPK